MMDGYEPKSGGVLELASKDRTRAIADVFQLANLQEREYTIQLRGLDRSRKYKVTRDNSVQTAENRWLPFNESGFDYSFRGLYKEWGRCAMHLPHSS
ncbi:MAG: hypothetical protein ACE3L7_07630 [Candidatus Pristimantibacillus sp.]